MVDALIPHVAIKQIIVSNTCPCWPRFFKVVNVAHTTPLAAITIGMFILLYRMNRLQA